MDGEGILDGWGRDGEGIWDGWGLMGKGWGMESADKIFREIAESIILFTVCILVEF